MSLLETLFQSAPYIALFITLALGYWVGKITIGRFVLGGVAGTLLMGVLVGQVGVDIDPGVKSIFFALFIYAVGYQGGPQFFGALNRKAIKILLSAVVMTVAGLLCVLAAAYLFGLDRGTAAGLAAGGLTQSAIIGTAGDAIAKLAGVSAEAKQMMQTNVAVGYAVTYIFGSLGPILMATWIIPSLMKWDIRKEALELAERNNQGKTELAPGEFNAITPLDSRAYQVNQDSQLIGRSLSQVNQQLVDANIAMVQRDQSAMDSETDVEIQCGDILVINGRRQAVKRYGDSLGHEVSVPANVTLVEENRQLIITNRALVGKSLADVKQRAQKSLTRGIYITGLVRSGKEIDITPDVVLEKHDVLQLTGKPADLNRVAANIGQRLGSQYATDFVLFGLGMVAGFLIGMISFKIAGIPVTIGSGAGCLISGLFVGWLRSKNPKVASLPMGASNFLRDFGLAVFVGIVGLQAGPQAIDAIRENGLALLFLGAGVTIIPQFIGFFFSYYVLRVRNPIEALAALTGGRSANPGFAALLEKAGNATPVFAFTVTYAIANVLLTLWGPVIIGIITTNVTP
ncbi:aspartate-alanine antiporter [Neiella sp. HB171785]|uniref:Aspartate-alanine antiporter n=1 Tax=Neiella litorisoli TaxID=2771431 RepID=A0A8J6UE28_9GAMM|nr:aspartate-alanine antiporter [Neiella litorisoli]MBD1389129.1 aspartate-alanine antiporter [Neiella litorisoli]